MAKATNTVLVIQGTGNQRTIVRTFEASEQTKTPLKAAKRFLQKVAEDTTHELHQAFVDGQLSYMGGHPTRVGIETRPTVVGL
ncbi:MAG: hypothetical protein GTO63_05770 [Anaerolineae bacterium]|nr:hypothetical protein [Anaerolineae bacterium]NIN94481.1 hypothetical protein [Anaerolineae bacterium]NIQ77549.1 hypothetical protein [Anaerolineae bacterium]